MWDELSLVTDLSRGDVACIVISHGPMGGCIVISHGPMGRGGGGCIVISHGPRRNSGRSSWRPSWPTGLSCPSYHLRI